MSKNVEDIFPLTELQEALLVHRQRAASVRGGLDTGLLLLEGRFQGTLVPDLFEKAWCETVAAEPMLRASVRWEGLKRPLHVVARTGRARVDFEDWTDLDPEERTRRWREVREDARRRGVDLGDPSTLATLAVVQCRADAYRWLWVCHHVLLDGWSSALVVGELVARYRSFIAGTPFEAPKRRAFRDYVAWLRERRSISGAISETTLDAAALLGAPYLSGGEFRSGLAIDGSLGRLMSETTDERLRSAATCRGVTPSALLLGCWALVLAEATGGEQPAFGFASSGRAADFEGLERMVGMFANALPMQPTIDRGAGLDEWFAHVFETQQSVQSVEERSLVGLLADAGVSLRRAPFDTFVAYANFPLDRPAGDRPTGTGDRALALVDFRGGVTSGYPLTLAALPGAEPNEPLRIEAHYARDRFEEEQVEALLVRWEEQLARVVRGDLQTVGELLDADRSVRPLFERFRLSGDSSPGVGRLSRGETPTPSETATEAQLMRIWNDLIEVQDYGIDDNFFDLGGHSLLVSQMVERVRQDFGVDLPLGAIVETPTVRRLAAWIDGALSGEETELRGWPSLVPIRSEGESAPLFMVHGLGGEVGWFYNLANYLDPSVPLFGLQSPREPHADLVEMAAHYISEIRTQRPTGPYRIGGYCVGGGVAYEMAQQLRTAGEEVEVLVLIDSVPQAHAFGESAGAGVGLGVGGLVGRLRRLAGKEPRDMLASVVDVARVARRRISRRVASETRPVELGDVLDLRTLPSVYHHASQQHFRAMRDYKPDPYDGEVWLFRTDHPTFGEDFGWGPLIGGRLHVEAVEGKHIDVLKEPNVAGLGRKLSRVLTAATTSSDRQAG